MPFRIYVFSLGHPGFIELFQGWRGEKNKTTGYNEALWKVCYNENDFCEIFHLFRGQACSDCQHGESKKKQVSDNQEASIL